LDDGDRWWVIAARALGASGRMQGFVLGRRRSYEKMAANGMDTLSDGGGKTSGGVSSEDLFFVETGKASSGS